MELATEDPRYPIGRFEPPATVSPEQRQEWILRIAALPGALRAAAAGLTPARLETPYREGGWTLRQVLHHVPDSHMQAYTRFKLALTEQVPIIKPYAEAEWAMLADTAQTPVEVSLALLDALHHRWVILLRSLDEAQWGRTFMHPETGPHRLDRALGLYAWHGDHHLAHVRGLRERMNW